MLSWHGNIVGSKQLTFIRIELLIYNSSRASLPLKIAVYCCVPTHKDHSSDSDSVLGIPKVRAFLNEI